MPKKFSIQNCITFVSKFQLIAATYCFCRLKVNVNETKVKVNETKVKVNKTKVNKNEINDRLRKINVNENDTGLTKVIVNDTKVDKMKSESVKMKPN